MHFDKKIITAIILAILAWGVYHAVGSYRLNHNVWRPMMVLGCVLGFVGFWLLMLRNRERRLRDQARVRDANEQR